MARQPRFKKRPLILAEPNECFDIRARRKQFQNARGIDTFSCGNTQLLASIEGSARQQRLDAHDTIDRGMQRKR